MALRAKGQGQGDFVDRLLGVGQHQAGDFDLLVTHVIGHSAMLFALADLREVAHADLELGGDGRLLEFGFLIDDVEDLEGKPEAPAPGLDNAAPDHWDVMTKRSLQLKLLAMGGFS